ncbi:hypothetical protein [Microbacterium rhizophilus]|uniref:hypothetical protein n=1 Tax=Microbacterium rhizophilus TaxID=3138934 RepID=UPI0031F11AD1
MRARIAVVLGAFAAAAFLVLGGAGAPGAPANAAGYAGPNAIAVPYTGEKVVKPAEGWSLRDCPAVLAAGAPLVAACDPAEGFTVVSPGYDPEFEDVVVPVAMSNGRSSTTIDYVLGLEPPAAPELPTATYPFPAPAGGVLLIPISDLGVQCTACADGGGLEVTSFAPEGVATVLPTETHLVVRPKPSFEGPLEITIRFGDGYDGWSQPTALTVPVSRQGGDAPLAQHVQRPLPAKGGEIDLRELIHVPAGAAEAESHVLCGGAIHGTVVCDAAGVATYRPFERAAVDQFSFHVARGGDLVTGSVTLVADGADVHLPAPGLAPAEPRTTPRPAPSPDPDARESEEPADASASAGPDGSGEGEPEEEEQPQEYVLLRVATAIAPPAPPEDRGAQTGVFAPLVELLDRVGAR